jgi:hypothetical protein
MLGVIVIMFEIVLKIHMAFWDVVCGTVGLSDRGKQG